MNAATGSRRGRGRAKGTFCWGTALCTASRTSRRCTPNFRATPWIVPRPNSYSRRICSNSSTVAVLRRISPPPTVLLVPGAYAAAAQGGPFPTIKLGQPEYQRHIGPAGTGSAVSGRQPGGASGALWAPAVAVLAGDRGVYSVANEQLAQQAGVQRIVL